MRSILLVAAAEALLLVLFLLLWPPILGLGTPQPVEAPLASPPPALSFWCSTPEQRRPPVAFANWATKVAQATEGKTLPDVEGELLAQIGQRRGTPLAINVVLQQAARTFAAERALCGADGIGDEDAAGLGTSDRVGRLDRRRIGLVVGVRSPPQDLSSAVDPRIKSERLLEAIMAHADFAADLTNRALQSVGISVVLSPSGSGADLVVAEIVLAENGLRLAADIRPSYTINDLIPIPAYMDGAIQSFDIIDTESGVTVKRAAALGRDLRLGKVGLYRLFGNLPDGSGGTRLRPGPVFEVIQ